MREILIIGGQGFIGKHLANFYVAEGYKVVTTTRFHQIVDNNCLQLDYSKESFQKLFKDGMQAIYKRVDGQDFMKVYRTTELLRKSILEKKRIGILHSDCLRFSKHSGANVSLQDQQSVYRKRNEYLMIKKKDPIEILGNYILKEKYMKLKELNNFKQNIFADFK